MKQLSMLLIIVAMGFQSSAAEMPKEFLESCFKDYVAATALPNMKESELQSQVVRRRCLSNDFNAKWNDLVSINGTGADAFLMAQDYLQSWKTDLQVINLKTYEANVILGKNKEEHCLEVAFIVENLNLKISSIQRCSKEFLSNRPGK